MIDKLKAFYSVFCAGQSVANPAAWKQGQMTGGIVAGLIGALVALSKTFGYEIHLTNDQLLQLGGTAVTLFGLFNAGITVASSDKVGLPGTKPLPIEPTQPVDSASIAVVPTVPAEPAADVPNVRRARNGDPISLADEPRG